ncbi:MAG: hypothetical protein QG627_17 [Chlamydiota bacterium]|jgi:hypothetical protein|nr:hypothetical protein [Chlamydiota bacterium]
MSVISCNIGAQLPQVCLLLKTPKPEATRAYYTAINSLISNSVDPISGRIHIAILPSDTAQAGFAFVGEKELNEIQDPDSHPIHFCSVNSDLFIRSISLPPGLIVILRSPSIEKTKQFYSNYKKCQEEQHGKGSKHYSIDWIGPFTEIYPERKVPLGGMEFIYQVPDLNAILEQLKKTQFKTISLDNSHMLINDPDGRQMKIIATS